MSSGSTSHALGRHHLERCTSRVGEHALGRPVLQRPRGRLRGDRAPSRAAKISGGKVEVSGRPPASEITSGRAVIAIRSRIAEERHHPRARGEQRRRSARGRARPSRRGVRPCGVFRRGARAPLSSTVIAPARYPTRVKLLLDILQGLGLSQAAGIRPFLPALVAGGAARADVLIDFEGGPFAFMEDPWWLAVLAALALGALIIRNEIPRQPPLTAAFQGLALGMGALLFCAVLSGDGYTWWPGIPAGLAGRLALDDGDAGPVRPRGIPARRAGARAPADLRRGRSRSCSPRCRSWRRPSRSSPPASSSG